MRIESYGSAKVYWPDFTREELIQQLRQKVPALRDKLPLKTVRLFGSWAKNLATAFSDVDVMVIYADPPRDDADRVARDALHVEGLEAHMYSESEAQGVAPAIAQMLRDSVDLMP